MNLNFICMIPMKLLQINLKFCLKKFLKLVKNIKLKYPNIELDYVVEENYKPLVQFNPNIKNVITIKDTNKEWDDVLKLLTSREYDEVFVPLCGKFRI